MKNLIAVRIGLSNDGCSTASRSISPLTTTTTANQQSSEPSTPFFETTPVPAHLVFPSTYENLIYGETHGVEVAANWKITDRWTLSPGFDFERIHMHASPLSQDTQTAPETNGSDPHVQAQLRSHFELSPRWTGMLPLISWIA